MTTVEVYIIRSCVHNRGSNVEKNNYTTVDDDDDCGGGRGGRENRTLCAAMPPSMFAVYGPRYTPWYPTNGLPGIRFIHIYKYIYTL